MFTFNWRIVDRLNCIVKRLDELPLWWIGLLQWAIMLAPNLLLGEGSVFTINDQWDESMMNYVLTARHPFEGVIPEMLGGINASGLAPSAVLAVPLYRILPPFYAFLCMYAIMVLCGFMGMYLAVKELTDSSILSVIAAGTFCMLPLYPVYGLSQMGLPMALYAFLCLYRRKRVPLSMGLLLLFGLGSHLVYTGYVVLVLASAVGIVTASRGRLGGWYAAGVGLLFLTFGLTNLNLAAEILLGRSLGGTPAYVSHREEIVNGAMPFWSTVWDVFCHSSQHAFTYHEKLIWPMLFLLFLGGICYRGLGERARKRYLTALGGMAGLVLIAVFYGVCKSQAVVAWKNGVSGFLHYFQAERFYWIYPAGWYLELALVFAFWWTEGRGMRRVCSARTALCSLPVQCLVIAALLLPTADTIMRNSYFYRNVNQRNNGSAVTGYISWESFYSEELMERLEEAVGREMSDYRVAHLGVSPAPALMHGFYTADGYSNNYPLAYKHAFRRVIAGELDKSAETAVYFDTWGNRCYLFNSLTGNYWLLPKGGDAVYEGLDFDMEALGKLGCEYLFSGAEIADAERMGLKFLGYYETETSYWGIWLYELL